MTDIQFLLQDLARRPTHVNELVIFEPTAIGMVDASGTEGISGIWISHLFPPTVFRIKYPPEILAAFQTGDITINDLELAGIVYMVIVLDELIPIFFVTMSLWQSGQLSLPRLRNLRLLQGFYELLPFGNALQKLPCP